MGWGGVGWGGVVVKVSGLVCSVWHLVLSGLVVVLCVNLHRTCNL